MKSPVSQYKLLACLTALCAMSGCDATANVESQVPRSAGYAAGECGRCTQDACRKEVEACGAERGCIGYLLCLGDCPVSGSGDVDAACEADCRRLAAPESQSTVLRLTQCRTYVAENDCPVCHDGVSKPVLFVEKCDSQMPPPPPDPDLCMDCRSMRCCESVGACDRDPSCAAILAYGRNCIKTKPPADQVACILVGYGKNPSGRAAFRMRDMCLTTNCWNECQGAPDPSAPQKRDICNSCSARYCRDEFLATLTSEACLDAFSCHVTCAAEDTACVSKCLRSNMLCAKFMVALVGCEQHYCLAECPVK